MTKEQEAARFIQERLKLEGVSSDNLKELLKEAIRKLVSISYEYRISPLKFNFAANDELKKRIDAVLGELVDSIIDDVRDIVANGEDDNERVSVILSWFSAIFLGMTFRQRIQKHIRSFATEVEGAIAASKTLGYSAKKASSLINAYLPTISTSPLFKELSNKNYSTKAIAEIHRGSGTYASSYKNLDRVVTDQVARVVQRKYYQFEYGNTTHWRVIRGSSYPCSLCDSCCGIVTNVANLPPFHPRCCCIAIPMD